MLFQFLCAVLAAAVVLLILKIISLRLAVTEIRTELEEKLKNDTNTLITVSSNDKTVNALADDLNTQLKELHRQRHRYEQGDLELKEAITNISHDLRTPLTAICAYLDLLKPEEKSDLAAMYLDKIENRTAALKQMTEELFRYTIAASNAESLPLKPVCINSVLEESISSYYGVIKKCRITPDIFLPEKKIVRTLNTDALFRIFENILNNAVKYTDGDLHITLTEDGQIIFSNHASGLSKTQVARLFDRFYTVSFARQSTGLGLSISKMLTGQMHGKMTAEYENDVLTICVHFPAEKTD